MHPTKGTNDNYPGRNSQYLRCRYQVLVVMVIYGRYLIVSHVPGTYTRACADGSIAAIDYMRNNPDPPVRRNNRTTLCSGRIITTIIIPNGIHCRKRHPFVVVVVVVVVVVFCCCCCCGRRRRCRRRRRRCRCRSCWSVFWCWS